MWEVFIDLFILFAPHSMDILIWFAPRLSCFVMLFNKFIQCTIWPTYNYLKSSEMFNNSPLQKRDFARNLTQHFYIYYHNF